MTRRALLIATMVVVAAAVGTTQDNLAVRVLMQLIASDPEASSLAIATWADDSGGYFTYRSEQQVVVRIPPDRIPELRALVETSGDTVVSYNPSAVDHGEALRSIAAAINSRTEALNRILKYLESADISATLEFERELRSLLQEIEYHAGRGRQLSNEVQYASVTVNLSSRVRTIPESRPSSFPWVNSIDLYQFLEEVRR